jgi:DNA polymerase III alpha subunit (gram-positive type)
MISTKGKITALLKLLKTKSRSRKTEDKITNREKDLIPTLELCEELYARGFKVAPVSVKESNSKK